MMLNVATHTAATYTFLSILVLLCSTSVSAEEKSGPDFYVFMTSCVAAGAGPGSDVKVVDAPQHSFACSRVRKTVECLFASEGAQKRVVFEVDADIPPLLYLTQGKNAGDFMVLNSTAHSANSITRLVLDRGGLVAKTCSGTLLTATEYEALSAMDSTQQEGAE